MTRAQALKHPLGAGKGERRGTKGDVSKGETVKGTVKKSRGVRANTF